MSWRRIVDDSIRPVVAANPEADEKTLGRLISAAYPFSERSGYRYKVWLDQRRRYLNARFPQRRLPKQASANFLPLFRQAPRETR